MRDLRLRQCGGEGAGSSSQVRRRDPKQGEKKRFITYDFFPKELKFAYQLKDGKLKVEGNYQIEPGEAYDLTGEWVRIEPPKKEDKK